MRPSQDTEPCDGGSSSRIADKSDDFPHPTGPVTSSKLGVDKDREMFLSVGSVAESFVQEHVTFWRTTRGDWETLPSFTVWNACLRTSGELSCGTLCCSPPKAVFSRLRTEWVPSSCNWRSASTLLSAAKKSERNLTGFPISHPTGVRRLLTREAATNVL